VQICLYLPNLSLTYLKIVIGGKHPLFPSWKRKMKLYSKWKHLKSQQSFRHENLTFEVSIGFFVVVFTLPIPTTPSIDFSLSLYIYI